MKIGSEPRTNKFLSKRENPSDSERSHGPFYLELFVLQTNERRKCIQHCTVSKTWGLPRTVFSKIPKFWRSRICPEKPWILVWLKNHKKGQPRSIHPESSPKQPQPPKVPNFVSDFPWNTLPLCALWSRDCRVQLRPIRPYSAIYCDKTRSTFTEENFNEFWNQWNIVYFVFIFSFYLMLMAT